MSTLTARCCRSLTEGLSKQLDRFPFQVYLKSSRATEVMAHCLETVISLEPKYRRSKTWRGASSCNLIFFFFMHPRCILQWFIRLSDADKENELDKLLTVHRCIHVFPCKSVIFCNSIWTLQSKQLTNCVLHTNSFSSFTFHPQTAKRKLTSPQWIRFSVFIRRLVSDMSNRILVNPFYQLY